MFSTLKFNKMQTKPFHESIVDAINNCENRGELLTLGKLLMATKIPKNHEEIIEAFKTQGKKHELTNALLEEKLSEEKKESEVIFREKSEFQKDNCLFCEKEATLEAVYGKSLIRCCASEECKKQAKKLALESGNMFD